MYLIRDIHNIDFFNKKFSSKPLIATIGNFDGLHLGHKEIIKKMKQIGDKDNLQSLVIFTEPHAKEFFAEQKALAEQPTRISPWRDKCKRLKENKVISHFGTEITKPFIIYWLDVLLLFFAIFYQCPSKNALKSPIYKKKYFKFAQKS